MVTENDEVEKFILAPTDKVFSSEEVVKSRDNVMLDRIFCFAVASTAALLSRESI
jgi:hypothetical protein